MLDSVPNFKWHGSHELYIINSFTKNFNPIQVTTIGSELKSTAQGIPGLVTGPSPIYSVISLRIFDWGLIYSALIFIIYLYVFLLPLKIFRNSLKNLFGGMILIKYTYIFAIFGAFIDSGSFLIITVQFFISSIYVILINKLKYF
jgi:hypothetical protein